MRSSFSCVQLFVTLWTVARQTPPAHGILQARILEWVDVLSSRRSSLPGMQSLLSCVSCIAVDSLPTEPLGCQVRIKFC